MLQILRTWFNRYFSDPQVLNLGFLLCAGFILIFTLGDMLTPVMISIVIAYLLDGMVYWLECLKLPRMVAIIVIFSLFIASLMVLLIWLLPLLSKQIAELLHELPDMLTRSQMELMQLPQRYPGFISEDQIREIIGVLSSQLTRLGQQILSLSLASVKGLILLLVYLILVPLLVFFFLKDKNMLIDWCKGFLPKHIDMTTEVWQEANEQIANYVRGKIWEIMIVWGVTYIIFMGMEVNFTLLLSLFVGLSVLVPYIGATVMFIPVGLIAFFQWGLTADMAYTLVAYAIIQALDGNLLVPLLLSGVVNLHPVAIIVAVLVFGGLWGLWGLFFAIPLATLLHAVMKAWLKNSKKTAGELR